MANWYVSSVAYASVAQWAASTNYTVGQIVRQLATPTLNNERCFRCTQTGLSGTTEPGWATGNNSVTTDNTVKWTETTGVAAYAWNAPFPRLYGLLNTGGKFQNGDTAFLSSDHIETTASDISYSINSVTSNGSYILCVDRTGNVPPTASDLSSGAVLATTTGNLNIQPVGLAYLYGITLRMGVGSASSQFTRLGGNSALLTLRKCRIEVACTGSASQINPVYKNEWHDVTVKFSNSGQKIFSDGPELTWFSNETARAIDPSGSIPNYLLGGGNMTCHLAGLDLSDLGANIFDHTTSPNGFYLDMRNCKVSPSFAQANPLYVNGGDLTYVNCDNGSTNYKSGKITVAGTEMTETTIVRSGGASDGTLTTSRKIVTTNGASKIQPFKSIPLGIWCDTAGSPVTATVYGIWNGGTVPNNDDIWITAEYLGNVGSPQGTLLSSGFSPLAASAPLPSDTSTWGGSTTKFKMSVTFTPQKKGFVNIYVRAAKASSTFYIDPQPIVA